MFAAPAGLPPKEHHMGDQDDKASEALDAAFPPMDAEGRQEIKLEFLRQHEEQRERDSFAADRATDAARGGPSEDAKLIVAAIEKAARDIAEAISSRPTS
jgi:hypothetical protein